MFQCFSEKESGKGNHILHYAINSKSTVTAAPFGVYQIAQSHNGLCTKLL